MTPIFDFSNDTASLLALLVVAAMFAMFLWERWTAEVVAIGGVAVMLVLGLLPYEKGL